MTPEKHEAGLRGIELMTAWAGGGSSTEFFTQRIVAMLDEARQGGDTEGQEGLLKAFAGLAEISGHLLIRLSQVTGETEQGLLQRIALYYQSPD